MTSREMILSLEILLREMRLYPTHISSSLEISSHLISWDHLQRFILHDILGSLKISSYFGTSGIMYILCHEISREITSYDTLAWIIHSDLTFTRDICGKLSCCISIIMADCHVLCMGGALIMQQWRWRLLFPLIRQNHCYVSIIYCCLAIIACHWAADYRRRHQVRQQRW